jgi:hypothetical protein
MGHSERPGQQGELRLPGQKAARFEFRRSAGRALSFIALLRRIPDSLASRSADRWFAPQALMYQAGAESSCGYRFCRAYYDKSNELKGIGSRSRYGYVTSKLRAPDVLVVGAGVAGLAAARA